MAKASKSLSALLAFSIADTVAMFDITKASAASQYSSKIALYAISYTFFSLIFFTLLFAFGGSPYLIYKYIIANREIYVNTFFINFL